MFFFEKTSKYVGVSVRDKTSKKPWQARISIGGELKYLGNFKTEIETAKCVNFVCKKESIKIKNPELSDEETETFTWPLPSKTVARFLYVFVGIDGFHFVIDKCLLRKDWFMSYIRGTNF